MTILDQARLHFKEEFFTARQFEKMTGVDFKIAAMNLTKRADEGKILELQVMAIPISIFPKNS